MLRTSPAVKLTVFRMGISKCYFQLLRRPKTLVPIFLSIRRSAFLRIPAISLRLRSFTSRKEHNYSHEHNLPVYATNNNRMGSYLEIYNAKINLRQIPLTRQPLKSLLCDQWHSPANSNSTPFLLLLIR